MRGMEKDKVVKGWNITSIYKGHVLSKITFGEFIVGAPVPFVEYLLVFQEHLVGHCRTWDAGLDWN